MPDLNDPRDALAALDELHARLHAATAFLLGEAESTPDITDTIAFCVDAIHHQVIEASEALLPLAAIAEMMEVGNLEAMVFGDGE